MVVDSEAHLQARALTAAEQLGWTSYHTHDSRRSAKGFPDAVLVRRERLVFAEFKVEAEQRRATLRDIATRPEWLRSRGITNEQARWLEALARTAAEVYVWRPSDWDAMLEVLR